MDGVRSSLRTLPGIVLITAVGVVATPSSGWAECVRIPATLKQAVESDKLVFVGDVLAVDAVIDPEPFRWRIRFQVVEAFKGTEPGERLLYFATTSDDFTFTIGTRVLVYAGGLDDRLSTACTSTRIVGESDPELLQLRKLPSTTK